MTEKSTDRARVLVVDDEKSIRVGVRELLTAGGYTVDVADDAGKAMDMLASNAYDIVISDIVMPGLSGIALLQEIRRTAPAVQVIMMTGEPTVETAAEAVRAGANDYLTKPVGKEGLLRSVGNAARLKRVDDERRRLERENAAYQKRLEEMVEERTAQLSRALNGTILAMATAVESRDPYTAGHQQRVASLGKAIAEELSLPGEQTQTTFYAALVHDLGKISVPAEILSNPGKLSQEAMSLVKKHPEAGFRILEKVDFPWPISAIVRQHHERLDGSGYPDGLSGAAIRLEARILAVADTVEAMASHRPYRPARGIEAALAEIDEGRGTRYDPLVVDACLRLFRSEQFAFEVLE